MPKRVSTIIIAVLLFLLVPGIVLAEVNRYTSTSAINKHQVEANGIDFVEIKVNTRDTNNNPAAGTNVIVATNRGTEVIKSIINPSDLYGRAVFHVFSTTPGTVKIGVSVGEASPGDLVRYLRGENVSALEAGVVKVFDVVFTTPPAANISLNISRVSAIKHSTFEIPVAIFGDAVTSYGTFTITYNPKLISFISAKKGGAEPIYFQYKLIEPGKISFDFAKPKLSEGDLARLVFEAKGKFGDISPLIFSSAEVRKSGTMVNLSLNSSYVEIIKKKDLKK